MKPFFKEQSFRIFSDIASPLGGEVGEGLL
jgi:hypothetical protein